MTVDLDVKAIIILLNIHLIPGIIAQCILLRTIRMRKH